MHTSKRMHFIEDSRQHGHTGIREYLHTSKRMHFIEEAYDRIGNLKGSTLAYVKTYALH